MIHREALQTALEELLNADKITDYCPNGLQVEGREEIGCLVTGVTASQALIDAAVAANADAILVHHGIFWRGDEYPLVGMRYRRVASLMQTQTNLFAYHLPLDVHPTLGNNAQLATRCGFQQAKAITEQAIAGLVWQGELNTTMPTTQFGEHLTQCLGQQTLCIDGGSHDIKKIAWCTGAAQDEIWQAIRIGADAYISGEISERTTHIARENNIHYFAVGHHASERYGVQALGEYLAQQYQLQHQFIDINNPA